MNSSIQGNIIIFTWCWYYCSRVFYSKKRHEKEKSTSNIGAGMGFFESILAEIIHYIAVHLPWYVAKIILILFGIGFIILSFMVFV